MALSVLPFEGVYCLINTQGKIYEIGGGIWGEKGAGEAGGLEAANFLLFFSKGLHNFAIFHLKYL
ncbi:MAG: hypothetical protein LDL41_16580 [Coleofasciculus sp. S288]|nr:hypothetical protein [Coleofasciculus sp. S288]